MTDGIHVEEVTIDLHKLEQFAAKMDWSVDRAVAATAFQVNGIAQTLVAVDTGALKNSIGPKRVRELVYEVGSDKEYAIYQELGTSKMAAHPYLVPALKKAIKQMYDAIKTELTKAMR